MHLTSYRVVRDKIMMTMTEDEHVSAPQPYGLVLAGNVAAARTRLRINQGDLAGRMRQLGWRWVKQTVSEVEAGRRAIRADELLGLALSLYTSIGVLTGAPPGVSAVGLPDGQPVGAQRVATVDGTFTWDGDQLKVTPSAEPGPLIDALITERRREAEVLESYRDQLHRRTGGEDER
jgi:hypothetical protein